jgi:hypothetical protein
MLDFFNLKDGTRNWGLSQIRHGRPMLVDSLSAWADTTSNDVSYEIWNKSQVYR